MTRPQNKTQTIRACILNIFLSFLLFFFLRIRNRNGVVSGKKEEEKEEEKKEEVDSILSYFNQNKKKKTKSLKKACYIHSGFMRQRNLNNNRKKDN